MGEHALLLLTDELDFQLYHIALTQVWGASQTRFCAPAPRDELMSNALPGNACRAIQCDGRRRVG
jgi:hypothetical protein